MQFYFIRHAQSQNNLLWNMTGSSRGRSDDPALSDVGLEQAHLLAQMLSRRDPAFVANGSDYYNHAGFCLTHLYSSLMLRAVATGAIVADALALPLVALQDLHETGGIYLEDEETGQRIGRTGKTRGYFQQRFPRLVLPETCDERGWWNRPFEEHEQAMARALRLWRDLLARHGNTQDRIAVFSHGDFYNCLLRAILGIGGSNNWFGLNNAGITRIDMIDDYVHLVYANRIEFLPPRLIT
jgi:2,3-bisphosphoglycerate-dependent phosphoglycerate mutase